MIKITKLQTKWSWVLIFKMLAVFYTGCAGPAEEKQEITERETVKMPPVRQNTLSPGTAKIEAHIIKMAKENNYHTYIIKVEKVLGYGMSTKPIGKGTEISLQISNNDKDLINLLSEGTTEEKYEFTVEQEQMVDNQLRCRAVKVKKIHSDH